MPDGTVIQAGPGNFPLDRVNALNASRFPVERSRHFFMALFAVPWMRIGSGNSSRTQRMT